MESRFSRLTLTLTLTLTLCLFLAGCAGVRSFTMGLRNTSLKGREAPLVTGTDWVVPLGAEEPEEDSASWRLYVFFNPG